MNVTFGCVKIIGLTLITAKPINTFNLCRPDHQIIVILENSYSM